MGLGCEVNTGLVTIALGFLVDAHLAADHCRAYYSSNARESSGHYHPGEIVSASWHVWLCDEAKL